jgi:hypothetical protein
VKVGIVGSEAAKFTAQTEHLARAEIRRLIKGASLVISGRSPLGGIDIWAVEEAHWAGIPTREHVPQIHHWEGEGGFRERNLAIARDSDLVACITVRTLPASYRGMRFPRGCYHCNTPAEHHVKSGGCWTMKQARLAGKRTKLVVVDAESRRHPEV